MSAGDAVSRDLSVCIHCGDKIGVFHRISMLERCYEGYMNHEEAVDTFTATIRALPALPSGVDAAGAAEKIWNSLMAAGYFDDAVTEHPAFDNGDALSKIESVISHHCGVVSIVGEWLPIESAPKDGTEVLLLATRAGIPGRMIVGHYMPGGYCIEDHPAIEEGWYFFRGSMFDKATKPTHWMPLPAVPPGVVDETEETK